MLKPLFEYHNLRKRYSSGDWSCTLVDEASHLAEVHPNEYSLRLLLQIRHAISGFDDTSLDELTETALRLRSDPSTDLKLMLLALLLELGQPLPDTLKQGIHTSALRRFPNLLAEPSIRAALSPSMAAYAQLASALVQSTQPLTKYWPEGAETGRICVVGNAPTESGKNNQQAIDGSGAVFRFNHVVATAEYQRGYGSRTDFWVVSPSYPVRAGELSAKNIVVSGITPWARPSKYWQNLAKVCQTFSDTRYFTFPAATWYELVACLRAPPSAGILCLATLLSMVSDENSVHAYGINRGPISTSNHYADKVKRSTRHNWAGESMLVNALFKEGYAALSSTALAGFSSN